MSAAAELGAPKGDIRHALGHLFPHGVENLGVTHGAAAETALQARLAFAERDDVAGARAEILREAIAGGARQPARPALRELCDEAGEALDVTARQRLTLRVGAGASLAEL
jgi:hypothetical protein